MTDDSTAAEATTRYPPDPDAVEKAILNNMAEIEGVSGQHIFLPRCREW